METAIVSLICIALVVFGGMTMSHGFLTSLDAGTAGLEQVGDRDETIMRTNLSAATTNMPDANTLEITMENTGQTKLADFEKWDIIVQYYDEASNYHTLWLPYTSGVPVNNEWTMSGILFNGGAEVFDPGVLNPAEQIQITAQLNPSVGVGFTNMVVVSTSNGITVSTHFSHN
jgi:hypothetical protein